MDGGRTVTYLAYRRRPAGGDSFFERLGEFGLASEPVLRALPQKRGEVESTIFRIWTTQA